MSEGEDESVAETTGFEMEVDGQRTEISVTGDRDTAVIVESPSGEHIYLPPEDFDRPAEEGQSAYDSPYHANSGAQDSPYDTHPDAASVTGMEPTARGYLIVHPEPVIDVRFLR